MRCLLLGLFTLWIKLSNAMVLCILFCVQINDLIVLRNRILWGHTRFVVAFVVAFVFVFVFVFVIVFQHLIVWRSGWLFGETCFNWNLKWYGWYCGGRAFSQLLHTALRTLQWLRYLDQNAKIRPGLNTSKKSNLPSEEI